MKKIVNGFAALLLTLAVFTGLLQSATPIYAADDTTTNSEVNSEETENNDAVVETPPSNHGEEQTATNEEVAQPEKSNEKATRSLVGALSLITLSGDATYHGN